MRHEPTISTKPKRRTLLAICVIAWSPQALTQDAGSDPETIYYSHTLDWSEKQTETALWIKRNSYETIASTMMRLLEERERALRDKQKLVDALKKERERAKDITLLNTYQVKKCRDELDKLQGKQK